MHRLSMVQALSLWRSLDDAYYGHGYDGHVAEIYVYRLKPSSPGSERNRNSASARAECLEANESLHNLLAHFAKERDAKIEIESYEGGSWTYVEMGDWLKTWGEDHRFHVRVRPRQQPKEAT